MTNDTPSHGTYERPEAQGLFDPSFERDACGVGFIANLKGEKSHRVISDALGMLCNLEHRGAVGADPLAGDGAGMLIQIPHAFFKDECAKIGITLPEPFQYAVGQLFMPQDERLNAHGMRAWERVLRDEGLALLGWRDVPVDNSCLSELVRATEPSTGRCSSRARPAGAKRNSNGVSSSFARSSRTRSSNAYKGRDVGHYTARSRRGRSSTRGCCSPIRSAAFYKDLPDPRLRLGAGAGASALLDQHLPVLAARAPLSLHRPQRRDQHRARQRQLDGGAAASMASPLFGTDISTRCGRSPTQASPTPPASTTRSSSDLGGYSLAHAVMMLIPEAWAGNPLMDRGAPRFYEYHAALMEPWDGPAAMPSPTAARSARRSTATACARRAIIVTDDDL